jgi:hypothetical protein
MSHSSTAKLVRLSKEKHPEYYCTTLGCLFRTETALGHRECPKHSVCTCGNNEDLCVSCQAKEERGIVARDVRLEKRQEREEYGQP